jgi:hypothetical protein
MRIEQDIKLDFKDVLIRPKRSTLTSRSEVDISRELRVSALQEEVPRHPDHRRQHGHHRHLGDGARARRAPALHALHKHYERRGTARLLRRQAAIVERLLLDGHHRARLREVQARHGPCQRHDRERLRRRRQRLHQGLHQLHPQAARAYPEHHDHGRQRRHRRDDRRTDPRRRRHRQGRHRPRLGVHHAQDGRRRLPAALGDHRMRRRGARPARPDLRRRRLHLAGRPGQGLRRRRRLRHARRHARRPRRMRLGPRRSQRRAQDALLRHELARGDDKYAGGVAGYRASEGKEVLLDYRGPVENTLQDILGGVRSACTYVGARTLKELSKRTTFVRVTAAV